MKHAVMALALGAGGTLAFSPTPGTLPAVRGASASASVGLRPTVSARKGRAGTRSRTARYVHPASVCLCASSCVSAAK